MTSRCRSRPARPSAKPQAAGGGPLTVLWLALAAAAWFASPARAAAPPVAPRPNVVVLLCDDLGYGDLGCFGHPVLQTPHLDRLAAGGLKLTACYAASPVCSPSRAGLLTGRSPQRAGILDWIPLNSGTFLRRDEVTVAALLKAAGYRTAHVGKWHLNSRMDGSEPTPGDHGFDHWFATQNNAEPSHEGPVNFVRNGKRVGPLKGNSSTLIVDEALHFLRAGKGPFFLNVWFHAPHEPVAAPDAFTRPYARVADATKRAYYGSVSLVDHEVGRLLRALDEMKLRDNTFVLFTSDNGPETLGRYKGATRSHGSPGPLRGMKLHLHEGGIRVPGIVSWPGHTRPGSVSAEPVCGVDLLPTLCELAGARPLARRALDGASFLPVLHGRPVARRVPLYWQFDRALGPWKVAVRQGPWKLLADAKLEKFALYNLDEDVGEARDLAARRPERVKELAAALRRLHRDVNARP
jgi:arylsulfatase A